MPISFLEIIHGCTIPVLNTYEQMQKWGHTTIFIQAVIMACLFLVIAIHLIRPTTLSLILGTISALAILSVTIASGMTDYDPLRAMAALRFYTPWTIILLITVVLRFLQKKKEKEAANSSKIHACRRSPEA